MKIPFTKIGSLISMSHSSIEISENSQGEFPDHSRNQLAEARSRKPSASDLHFVKMHGTGNDFIVIDEFEKILVPEGKKSPLVVRISNRHFGIGSDGVIFIQNSKKCDVKFSFYNPDGSKAEMCGNGMRCLAKYVYERGLVKKKKIEVETVAGLVISDLCVENGIVTEVRVDMGSPEVEFVNRKVEIHGNSHQITSVNMGNPHAIIFSDNIDRVGVKEIGRKVRHYKELFSQGTNVHFVQKIGKNEFKIRSYERGVEDETLACGTGICAAGVAIFLNKITNSDTLLFHAKGGDLTVELKTDKERIARVYLIGSAEEVFTGEIECDI